MAKAAPSKKTVQKKNPTKVPSKPLENVKDDVPLLDVEDEVEDVEAEAEVEEPVTQVVTPAPAPAKSASKVSAKAPSKAPAKAGSKTPATKAAAPKAKTTSASDGEGEDESANSGRSFKILVETVTFPDGTRPDLLVKENCTDPAEQKRSIQQDGGRLKGKNPMQAAKKAFTKIARAVRGGNDEASYIFTIQETTRGSKKEQFPYIGERVRQTEPRVIEKKSVNKEGKEVVTSYRIEFKSNVKAFKGELPQPKAAVPASTTATKSKGGKAAKTTAATTAPVTAVTTATAPAAAPTAASKKSKAAPAATPSPAPAASAVSKKKVAPSSKARK